MSELKLGHETNLLLSQNTKVSLNTWKTKLGSLNMLVIGATGEGKSRYVVRPLAYSSPVDPRAKKGADGKDFYPKASFVFTDPKGELYNDTAGFFMASGYKVKVLNLVNMSASDCYNPFKYIYYNLNPDNALEILIDGIVNIAKGQNSNADPHWTDNAKSLLNSIGYFVFYELPAKMQNFDTINQMIKLFKMGENDKEAPIDKLLRKCQQFPLIDHPAVQWRNKISAKGGELSSIVSSADTALKLWTNDNIKRIMNVDNIDLDTIGDEPTALYVITPVSNSTYDNIVATFYNQLFETLMYKAESVYKNKGLPHHVFVVQDEFANTGKIPNYDKKIATFRSCNISSIMIVQSPNQLKSMYDKEYQSIIDNTHITIFLGNGGLSADSNDISAAGFISRALGYTTIKTQSESISVNQNSKIFNIKNVSTSINIQKRELMTPDEVRLLSAEEEIVIIKGEHPIIDKKIDLDSCLNYSSDLFSDEIIIKDENGNEKKSRKLKDKFKFDINETKSTYKSYEEGLEKCNQIDKMSSKIYYEKVLISSNYNKLQSGHKSIKYIKPEFVLHTIDLSRFIAKNIDNIEDRIVKNFKLNMFYVTKEHIKEQEEYIKVLKKIKEEKLEFLQKQGEKQTNGDSQTDPKGDSTIAPKSEEQQNIDIKNNVSIDKEENNNNAINKENFKKTVKSKLIITRSKGIELDNSLNNKINELQDMYNKFKEGIISNDEMKKYLNTSIGISVSNENLLKDGLITEEQIKEKIKEMNTEINKQMVESISKDDKEEVRKEEIAEEDDYVPDED